MRKEVAAASVVGGALHVVAWRYDAQHDSLPVFT